MGKYLKFGADFFISGLGTQPLILGKSWKIWDTCNLWSFLGLTLSSTCHTKLGFGSGIFATLGWYCKYLEPVPKLLCHPRIERFTCASGGRGMSLTCKINRIGERVLPWGTPWMGVIMSLSWSLIEIVSLLWWRKFLIHLINFLLRLWTLQFL